MPAELAEALRGLLLGGAVMLVLMVGWTTRRSASGGGRQASQRGRPSGRVQATVWRRDRGACVVCGCRDHLAYEHIIPVNRGGSNAVRNLELRCQACTGLKVARI
jgi:hypothetical protein